MKAETKQSDFDALCEQLDNIVSSVILASHEEEPEVEARFLIDGCPVLIRRVFDGDFVAELFNCAEEDGRTYAMASCHSYGQSVESEISPTIGDAVKDIFRIMRMPQLDDQPF